MLEKKESRYKQMYFRINCDEDADLISWIKSRDNFNSYICNLLREEMMRYSTKDSANNDRDSHRNS